MRASSSPAARGGRPAVLARRAAACAGLRVVALQAGASDHAVRVRGDAQRVSWFCSDLSTWPAWSPLTKKASKLGLASDPVMPGTRFELRQELWGLLSYPMSYTVVEYEAGKKLVLSGVSEHHTQLDQFVFMPDRADARMTVVRYVSDARLRQWKGALQPVMSKMLARVPEESLSALQTLLNGPRSPLLTLEFQEAWQRQTHAAADASKGRGSTAGGGQRARKAGGGGGGGWGAMFGGGGAKRGAAFAPAVAPAPVDPAGHYAALGLSPAVAAGASPADSEVRAAYRRLAAQWHPDRQSRKSAAEQERAVVQFSRVMRAYDVLKDPAVRQMYEQGRYIESSIDL